MSNIIFSPTPPSTVYDKAYQGYNFPFDKISDFQDFRDLPGPDTAKVQDYIVPFSHIPEFRSSLDPHITVNQQQERLFNDKRVSHQLEVFNGARNAAPPTYYSALAPAGIQILSYGKPAKTGFPQDNPDFLYGNCHQLEEWLVHGTGDKLFLLRDPGWFHTRPQRQGSTILQELKVTSTKPIHVEVQELGKEVIPYENSVKAMSMDEVIAQFDRKDRSHSPINLLSLQCQDDGIVPWPLAKHCNLLNQAAASAAASSQSMFLSMAGKQSTEVMSKFIDLQSCMHFQIFGQAGAISGWHIDAIGPYTYITLEPNYSEEPAEHVLKLWAYIRTDNISFEEQVDVLTSFVRDGETFMPDPKYIRIISLVAGDTLVMPPGTIHAPITITNCLFRGGMVMQKRQMRKSMHAWRFCSDNGGCTNENQPRQARAILDYFKTLVEGDPIGCGYEDKDGMAEFEEDAKIIGGESMICGCKTNCVKGKCGCVRNTQRCGSRCHAGVSNCDNPFGCEAKPAP